jgi:Leucine-rich repeat (LRR) protein
MQATIPTEISSLQSFKALELSGNNFMGTIPKLSALTQLSVLRLDNNKLTGDVPMVPSSLTSCDLQKNKFNNLKNSNAFYICLFE